jgi:hypothetical protein
VHNLCSENLCGSDARFQRTASLCSSGCRFSGVLCGRSALFRGIALPSRSRAAGVRGEARGHLLAITAAVLVGFSAWYRCVVGPSGAGGVPVPPARAPEGRGRRMHELLRKLLSGHVLSLVVLSVCTKAKHTMAGQAAHTCMC